MRVYSFDKMKIKYGICFKNMNFSGLFKQKS